MEKVANPDVPVTTEKMLMMELHPDCFEETLDKSSSEGRWRI